MSKYIDLELALNELLCLYEGYIERYGAEIRCGIKTPVIFDYRRAKEALQSIPTIDAVHCKDCVKGYKGNYFDGIACSIYGDTRDGYPVAVMEEDDFCSRGEKRQKDEVTKVALQTMIDWAEKQKEK